MDLENEFKVGDKVICIAETDNYEFIGSTWMVVSVYHTIYDKKVYECVTHKPSLKKFEKFVFRSNEIILYSPLMEALLCQT